MSSDGNSDERRARLLACTLLFLWTAVILLLGSGQGSMAQTSRFIRPLIEFFLPSAAPETVLLIHAIVRKSAHFIEYFIFTLLAIRAFTLVRDSVVSQWRIPLSLAAALGLAAVDEFVQSFNSMRTGSAFDVLIDLAGAGAAAASYCVFAAYRHRLGRNARND